MPALTFELLTTDSSTAARRGRITLEHGVVNTPAFMPVGTVATVKGIDVPGVQATGAEIILGNTYHLALRPGEDLVAEFGGLHQFMGWRGPILTDSGGFQIFSLAKIVKITDEAARFRSHIDGSLLELSPERAVQIQARLGSDIAMVLDHVVRLPSTPDETREAVERTILWAARARESHQRDALPYQAQFGIVQGGLDPDLRIECSQRLCELDFDGYAIGGLSVGETPEEMYTILRATTSVLPTARPRYLMGVGQPWDLLQAIGEGVDMFDCVLPTRNGRNALAYSDAGPVRLRNKCHERDQRPLEEGCPCPACAHSRGYLRHLFMSDEMLGPILLTAHNLTYYQRLMRDARAAIEAGDFRTFAQAKVAGWAAGRTNGAA